jgi:hypothetical protein
MIRCLAFLRSGTFRSKRRPSKPIFSWDQTGELIETGVELLANSTFLLVSPGIKPGS